MIFLEGSGCVAYQANEVAALARIALAAKQAKPVGYLFVSPDGVIAYSISKVEFEGVKLVGPIYSTPPANSPAIPDGWIKCSDRMPSFDERIVILSRHGEVIAGETDVVGFLDLHDGTSIKMSEATHWMPLPAHTKPESE